MFRAAHGALRFWLIFFLVMLLVALKISAQVGVMQWSPRVSEPGSLWSVASERPDPTPFDDGGVDARLVSAIESSPAVESAFGWTTLRLKAEIRASSEDLKLALVRGELFSTLRVHGGTGRLLPGARQAVISHRLAVAHFGGSKAALGAHLRVFGRSMNDDPSTTLTIVGVAPPGFRGPRTNDEHDIWISWEGWPDILLPPLESDDSISGMFPLEVVLRARPTVDAARMAGALARLIELAEQPAMEGARLVAYPGPSTDGASYSGQARRSGVLATLGVLLVMLACSAMVALESMLLARTRIDSATRMALGEPAGVRWLRLGRALLTNGLPPVLAAAAASGLIVMWIRSSAHGELAATVLRLDPLQVTFWIAGIAAASFCIVALVLGGVGLFSMTSTSSPEFSRVRQASARPIRSPFLVAAAGSFMAVALAIAAWMELDTQLSRSLGFRTEGIQYSLIIPSGDVSSAFERLHSQRSIEPLRQALDGVLDTEVVLASGLPLGVSLVAELMDGSGSNGPRFFFNEVTPGYFRIFGSTAR